MARMAAFWVLAILIFYGCVSLHTEVASWSASLAAPLGGIRIPVIGENLSPAFLISTLTFAASMFLLSRWQNKPKNADLLIETEQELRKVTWPSIDEAVQGSVTVMVCVIFLMVYLASADWVLGKWARIILLGRG